MRKQSGFTLIELMIVVAIVGILAAIAIPAYKDFQVRSKVSEVLAAMGACKTTLAEFYQSNNGWMTPPPSNNPISANICQDAQAAGDRSQYLDTLVVDPTNGEMTALTQNTGALAEGTIIMTPVDAAGGAATGSNDIYTWNCGAGTIDPRYLPGSCADF